MESSSIHSNLNGAKKLKYVQTDTKLFRKVKEIGDKQKLQDYIDKLVKWSKKMADVMQFWEM